MRKQESENGTTMVPMERTRNSILLIRGQKVMLRTHLAELYGVPTKVLNPAVKRNIERFPGRFHVPPRATTILHFEVTICDSKFGCYAA